MMIALLATAALASSPYSGFEPLKPGDDGAQCTADASICVAPSEPHALMVTRNGKTIASWSLEDEEDGRPVLPLPALIRLNGGRLLVGALRTSEAMYSGGGGSASEQVLALIEPGKPAKSVLTAPGSGELDIRACFSEKDARKRLDACSDEYQFVGVLAVAGPAAGEPPPLSFRMTASHYPRGVSRNADSLTLPPLRKADLAWEDDKRCTYRRTFRFDQTKGLYVAEAPLPDCSDYTEP